MHSLFYPSFLDEIYFYLEVNLGQTVTLNNRSKADDKSAIIWLFNKNCTVACKQPGKEAITVNNNYEIENDGMFLVIPNMKLFLLGDYERLVGNDSTVFSLHGM